MSATHSTPRPSKTAKKAASLSDSHILIRGVRQNNLKNIDLDLPLGKLNVITGPSGSGKSSLAFQTLYAEGQRRYIETFSPYTRQFFDRMDKPQVDAIHGIPPAIAIEQSNKVKTTRSTVGTITEINDYLKLFFPRIAQATCPECQQAVRPETPSSVAQHLLKHFASQSILITFGIPVGKQADPTEFFEFLQAQGYLRVQLFGKTWRTDQSFPHKKLPAIIDVIQDRVKIPASAKKPSARLLEAVETAFQLGKGKVSIHPADSATKPNPAVHFSRHWHCAHCDLDLHAPTPNLFTFNNPLGACPECRGFGRVIGIDLDRALPDPSLSIREGLVKAFHGNRHQECQVELELYAGIRGIDINAPFEDLAKTDQQWILQGEYPGDADKAWSESCWYGVRGFFDWLETRTYRMHVRVFLSRFRSYTKCHACEGTRLQPEALNYRAEGKTLPEIWQLPINEALNFLESIPLPANDSTAEMLHSEVCNRLRYLEQVGLSYLNLDRPTRTLSGGETERVNLTTCLGASLTSTLFVLDEPTVGLHPRDTDLLIKIMQQLRDNGNTLAVVEHDESVIRAADHLIDIGPGRGEDGGELVFTGSPEKLAQSKTPSLTAAYLSGKKCIPIPAKRRKVIKSKCLKIVAAQQHNLQKIDVDIPLHLFTCVTGVSGSGKSTLVHSVLYENLLQKLGQSSPAEPGRCKNILGHQHIDEVIMVDQAPLARTPRSTPAVYTGVFELIRKLFTDTEEAKARQLTPGYFSFNSGAGRCERCWGNGFEKVEMQFLSDLYVTCPECEGSRYTPEALEYQLTGKNIHQILNFTITQAIAFFFALDQTPIEPKKIRPDRRPGQIVAKLQTLAEVGLGYLRLGQALNTLSGGESQRLKLVGHLLESVSQQKKEDKKPNSLLIFDEPTTGLHFDDIAMLLQVFDRLVEAGNTVLVIEHHLEVIKCADHLIDLGPEAGSAGGTLVATGTPEEIATIAASHTGRYLAPLLSGNPATLSKVAETAPLYSIAKKDAVIALHGAREHNLKNISIEVPRNQLVVVTGLSGSGKSTLAFDIIFAEGQRRFLDSMSAYARQFVEQLERPDIDHITGLPPTVAIEQRISRGGGKSTVATVTEVYHFLRLLFAKTGIQHSPDTGKAVTKQSVTAILTRIRKASTQGKSLILAPIIKARKGFHTDVAQWAERKGYTTLLVDGELMPVKGFQKLARFKEHSIDVVIAEISKKTPPTELRSAIEDALRIGKNTAHYRDSKGKLHIVSTTLSDPDTGRSFEEPDPRMFSFNSPHGYCPTCRGYGAVPKKQADQYLDANADSILESELQEESRRSKADITEFESCPECHGARLNEVSLHVKIQGHNISDITHLSVSEAQHVFDSFKFKGHDALIARDILPEICQRLRFMEEVGLGYLQLDRSANTLSGGESQRIRLASQLGSNLRGVLYILDEPTIGLHPRDNQSLLDTLIALRDKGNSLLVVEHDEETLRRADHVIDLGPAAGQFGGEVVFSGPPKLLSKKRLTAAEKKQLALSPTALAMREPVSHPLSGKRRPLPAIKSRKGWLKIKGASLHNIHQLDAQIPLNRLTVISGISGSGKSTLIRGVLLPAVKNLLDTKGTRLAAPLKSISGVDGNITAVYEVDQSPIGKTSRSTPATYVKLFDHIRKLFAQLPDARTRGYTASRFSFNTEGGRCEACKGNGRIKLEMSFLPTSYIPCEECQQARYNAATLEVEYNGKNIGQVMDMTIDQAAEFFSGHPTIYRTLNLMRDTGLDYLTLGQPSPSLSGGEAQRIKLVAQLTRGIGRSETARLKSATGKHGVRNLYVIEEPSIGLHMADVTHLIQLLHRLVDDGHTVIVIEHNLDIIAEADYILDIGPEAGPNGGSIVASGTPEQIAQCKESRTAPFLKKLLPSSRNKLELAQKRKSFP
ncbi:MAG: excinuclease ABC subunit UvrA [Verrucomicrobiales bacterium]|nr:excinuclease ABC subunit UvrA [Verrucomicrobiales bacterium]